MLSAKSRFSVNLLKPHSLHDLDETHSMDKICYRISTWFTDSQYIVRILSYFQGWAITVLELALDRYWGLNSVNVKE